MPDQADILRYLVAGKSNPDPQPLLAPPPIVAVAGAKGGVGTTTIAVNLALALAARGQRTALVDADFHRPDVIALCGMEERYNVADVLRGRRDLHEAAMRGPLGVLVVPGTWADGNALEARPAAVGKLIDQFASLGRHVDRIVIDVGCDLSPAAQLFWQSAERVLVVTSPDAVSVMDAYAGIKVAGTLCSRRNISLVVNCACDATEADGVHGRIAESCRRFLNLPVACAGWLAADAFVAAAAGQHVPFYVQSIDSPAHRALDRLAEGICATHDAAALA